jgi:hypothetical protein
MQPYKYLLLFTQLLVGFSLSSSHQHDLDDSPIKFRSINEVIAERANSGHNSHMHTHSVGDGHSRRSCGIIEPTNSEMDAMHRQMEKKLAAKRAQGVPLAVGASIGVVFHVIMNTANEGMVTSQQIQDQITVLNNAFADGGWTFYLIDIAYITNDVWFSGMEIDEFEAKLALRRGTGETLNIYTAELFDHLGWAYFPSTYSATHYYYDGVVMDYRSMPGGSDTRYNGGDTGAELYYFCHLYNCVLI